ncbi:MAG TPA: branched-chain-amino-acid transaminase [Sediminibacterium sp.]|nr:branched-chain-amino-acid transaminase [Sediminibacterium sp.]
MASYYHQHTIVYLDGNFVPVSGATTDLYSQSLHYGYAVFEGIRSYRTVSGETRIFKADAHFNRLAASAKALNMPYPWEKQALIDATYRLLAQNNLQDAYIRPLVFAPANMSFQLNTESHIVIQVWQMAPFLGEKMLRVTTSPYQRPNPAAFPIEAKASGLYVNSILASQEAKARGYDEALLHDMQGYVAEAPGANLFFEKGGTLFTPATGNILPGITRATVLELCDELHIPVEEGSYHTKDIYGADAAFFCGTAAEIIGMASLDDHAFSLPWEQSQSRLLQQAYTALVKENHLNLANEIAGIE